MAKSPNTSAQFNILRNDPTRGEGGYGVGTISLENITPIIVDPGEQEVFINMGALHARSQVEKKVRFKPVKDELVDPKLYWIVWMALQVGEGGPFYSGAGACEIMVSQEEKRIKSGYKSLPEHVNTLDKVLKGRILISHMDSLSKSLLKDFLIDFNEVYWERSPEELKNEFL
ncbi:YwhD family protein [Bacillus salacetis]|uniref:YwhD family protein n=1 Tax=Bacillus salacetis TaxID=2315464 RepID=UPI003B9FB311